MPLTEEDCVNLLTKCRVTSSFAEFLKYFCQNENHAQVKNWSKLKKQLYDLGLQDHKLNSNPQITFAEEILKYVSTTKVQQLKNAIKKETNAQKIKFQMEQCQMHNSNHPLYEQYRVLIQATRLTTNDIRLLQHNLKRAQSFFLWYQPDKNQHNRRPQLLEDALKNNIIRKSWEKFVQKKIYRTRNMGKHAAEAAVDRFTEENSVLLSNIQDITDKIQDAIENVNEFLESLNDESDGDGIIIGLRASVANLNAMLAELTEKGVIENFNEFLQNAKTITAQVGELLKELDVKKLSKGIEKFIDTTTQADELLTSLTELSETYTQSGKTLQTVLKKVEKNADNISENVRDAVHDGRKFAVDFKDSIQSTSNTIKKAIIIVITLFFLFISPIIFPVLAGAAAPIFIALAATFLSIELFLLFAAKPLFNLCVNVNNIRKDPQYRATYLIYPSDWLASKQTLQDKKAQRDRDKEVEKLKDERKKKKNKGQSEELEYNLEQQCLAIKIRKLKYRIIVLEIQIEFNEQRLAKLSEQISNIKNEDEKLELKQEQEELPNKIKQMKKELKTLRPTLEDSQNLYNQLFANDTLRSGPDHETSNALSGHIQTAKTNGVDQPNINYTSV